VNFHQGLCELEEHHKQMDRKQGRRWEHVSFDRMPQSYVGWIDNSEDLSVMKLKIKSCASLQGKIVKIYFLKLKLKKLYRSE